MSFPSFKLKIMLKLMHPEAMLLKKNMINKLGRWPWSFHVHPILCFLHLDFQQDRDLLTDLRDMLCADALAVSKSSLHVLNFAHARAKIFFVPVKCGPGTFKLATRIPGEKVAMFHEDNTTLLHLEKPQAEVGPFSVSFGDRWAFT